MSVCALLTSSASGQCRGPCIVAETEDSGTAAPQPSVGAAAGSTFQLEVNTLAGGCLVVIPDAQGSWHLGDVLSKMPEVLPGHRYQLVKGEAVLAPGTAIAHWAQPVDGKTVVTAVVLPRTQEEQRQLNVDLIKAARALDVEKVVEFLSTGADTTFRMGFPPVTALHAAVEARRPRRLGKGDDGERDEEEDGRLEAVLSALLSAQADVNDAVASGRFALHSAVQRGTAGPVRALLDARAHVDAVSKEVQTLRGYVEMECESTALHVAAQAGNLPLAALLLERGANVNAVRRYREQEYRPGQQVDLVAVRETALHMAVAGGHEALVALLVQARADVSIAQSRDGEDISFEELCVGKPGMLDAAGVDSSAALLAGGAFGPEAKAALTAAVARRAAE